jgi:putative restriction endonuclease
VPIQLAWDALGERNGSLTMAEMLSAIRKYRTDQVVTPQTRIGCRVLTAPVFFEEGDWFDVPASWSTNIVTGKVYTTDTADGSYIWEELHKRTSTNTLFNRDQKYFNDGFFETPQARYGEAVLVKPRLGQGGFRIKIAEAYNFECALSDTRVLPALEAAHIKPYADGGSHEVTNGIFFRRDIHSVFDAGFATLDDNLRFVVSKKIVDVFNNGNEYRRLHGTKLKSPISLDAKPSLDLIRWHQSEKYVGDM